MSPDSRELEPVVLEARGVGCVRGDRRLFRDISFSLTPGSFLQLTGPNGSGKTSLLRIICGLLEASEGEIRWRGSNIRASSEEYFEELTYLGHRNGIKEELSSIENLRISAGLAGGKISNDDAREVLAKLGLGDREHLPARFLSEGQRRRAALARLLSRKTVLWVLDEVLTSLDKAAAELIKTLIEQHLDNGGIAIAATHQEISLSRGSLQRLELIS